MPAGAPVRRQWAPRRSSRGATEVGVALVVVALAAGVLFGSGLAETAIATTDGLTWLGDDTRGEAVQVNPATGRPENRLAVAPPGAEWRLAQRDGLLVITEADGTVSVIDVATLALTGRHRGAAGIKVLLDAASLYAADLAVGRIARLDPGTATVDGEPWTAGGPLADAAIDGTGTVWALRTDGELVRLVWAGSALAAAGDPMAIPSAGPRSALVAHPLGVTVLTPEGGAAIRIGTGHDAALPVPQLAEPMHVPEYVPADLVPVSLERAATVLLIEQGERVISVGMAGLGCDRPGRPASFAGHTYVPCLGTGRVVVLDGAGRPAPQAIELAPGGDPELTLDDSRLFATLPGTDGGVVVAPDGTRRLIVTHTEDTPLRDPADPPTIPPPTQRPLRRDRSQPSQPESGGDSATGERQPPPGGSAAGRPSTGMPPGIDPRTSPTPGGSPPSVDPGQPCLPGTPTGVAASASTNGEVLVTWQPATGDPEWYRVLRTDTDAEVASVGSDQTSATITTVPPGTTTAFVIEAGCADGLSRSAPSNPVTVHMPPAAPGAVAVTYQTDTGTSITVTVRWNPGQARGTPVTGHRITVTTDSETQTRQAGAAQTNSQFTLSCGADCWGERVAASVVAQSTAGDSAAGQGTYTHPDAPPGPRDGDDLNLGGYFDAACHVSTLECRQTVYYGEFRWNPPATWRDFEGTCTIRAVGDRGTTISVSVNCAGGVTQFTRFEVAPRVVQRFTVSMRACGDGGCVQSRSATLTAEAPDHDWCGSAPC